eukprot:tig00000754_g3889.t1
MEGTLGHSDVSARKIDELKALVGDTYHAWKKKRGGSDVLEGSAAPRVRIERRRPSVLPQSDSSISQATALEFRAEAEGSATIRFKIPSLHADLLVHLDDADADGDRGEEEEEADVGGGGAGSGPPSRPASRSYRSRLKKANQSFKSILQEIEAKIADAGYAHTGHVDLVSGTPLSLDVAEERLFRLKKGTTSSPIVLRIRSASGAALAYAAFHVKKPSKEHHRWLLGEVAPNRPLHFTIPANEFGPMDQELHIGVYPTVSGAFGGCSLTVEATCERINALKYLSGIGFQETVSPTRGPHYVSFETRSRQETQVLVVNLVAVTTPSGAGAVAYISPRDNPYPCADHHVWALDSRTNPKLFISPEHALFGGGLFSACIDFDTGPDGSTRLGSSELPFTFSANMQRRSSAFWRATSSRGGPRPKGAPAGDGEGDEDEDEEDEGEEGYTDDHAAEAPDAVPPLPSRASTRRGSGFAALVPPLHAANPRGGVHALAGRRASMPEDLSPRRGSPAGAPAPPRTGPALPVRSHASPPLGPAARAGLGPAAAASPRAPLEHAAPRPRRASEAEAGAWASPPRPGPGRARRSPRLPNLTALKLSPDVGELPVELSPRGSGAVAAAILHSAHAGSSGASGSSRRSRPSVSGPSGVDSPHIQAPAPPLPAPPCRPAERPAAAQVTGAGGSPVAAAPAASSSSPPGAPTESPSSTCGRPSASPPPRRPRRPRLHSSPDERDPSPGPSKSRVPPVASTPVADLFLSAHAKDMDRLETGASILERTLVSYVPGEEGEALILARSEGVLAAASKALAQTTRRPTDAY